MSAPVETAGAAVKAVSTGTSWGDALAANAIFSAGFGLVGVGVGLTALRYGAIGGLTLLKRRLLVTLEISNRDPGYDWFLTWLETERRTASKSLGLASRWTRSADLSLSTRVYKATEHSAPQVDFNFLAGVGRHYLQYRGAWIQVERERQLRNAGSMDSSPVWETVKLTTLSRDGYKLFPDLLSEARALAIGSLSGKLVIRVPRFPRWESFGLPREIRPIHSVVLDDGISERIQADLVAFGKRRTWYAERGVPYRRGYLLHGPPGSGKSSFIRALAGSYGFEICVLNLAERGLTDDRLNQMLSSLPDRSFLLMEDVDAVFNKRAQTSADGYQSSVTFSGLLNALDGVASGEERVLFLTTNYIDRLDPALIRPGRIDVVEYLGDVTPRQARRYFEHFFLVSPDSASGDTGGHVGADAVQQHARDLERYVADQAAQGRATTMAALQGHFIVHPLPHALQPELIRDIFHDRPLPTVDQAGLAVTSTFNSPK
ncbi:BCS1 N terminal-domain-containing protein [Auriculariales sp. MPI-PUGE-AT-0066]|nr:BCS1 N terminal-domain-containing protein [Auriculariales sp. MPI-PUGE-AT-0066]